MFWGVSLESGKRYRQVVGRSYHVSNAALEVSSTVIANTFVAVWLEHCNQEFLLCTLDYKKVLQAHLDLCFVEGEEVEFHLVGKGTVHLTGYTVGDDMEGEDSDKSSEEEDAKNLKLKEGNMWDSEEDDEDWKPKEAQKRKHSNETNGTIKSKGQKNKSPQEKKSPGSGDSDKRAQLKKEALSKVVTPEENSSEEEEDDSSDDELDEDFIFGKADKIDDESWEDESEDEDDDDDDDDSDVDKEEYGIKKAKLDNSKATGPSPGKSSNMDSPRTQRMESRKSPKQSSPSRKSLRGETPNKTNKNQENGSTKKEKKQRESIGSSPSQKSKSPGQKTTPDSGKKSSSQGTPPIAKKVFGGVNIQDTKAGNGPVAKPGKMVHVYYRGTLPNNNEFDSCLKGKPFSFRLGKSEVIKGWDVGIQGMKVGGKRNLIVPPAMGYGNKQTGPIPANSTLHFEVELKAVS